MLMKVAVLGGAGLMGSGVVRDLMWSGVERVIVADSRLDKAEQLVRELKDERLESRQLDVSNGRELDELLRGVDVCVNGVPTLLGHQLDIMQHSLEAGCRYVDIGGLGIWTGEQKKLHDQFVKKGVAALLGMGSAPGITNVLAKHCAEQLDTVEKINIYWTGKTIGPNSQVFVPPYNILTLIDEYSEPNRQFIDGELKEVAALSGSKILSLPEPFGVREFQHTIHSETTTIPFARGITEKGIRECTWRLSMPEQTDIVMRSLLSCGFGDKEKVNVKGIEVSPQDFLSTMIDRNIRKNENRIPASTFDDVKDYELYTVIGEGAKNGRPVKITVELLSLPDRFYDGYVDAGTSMGVSIGAQMLGNGDIAPGVWAPEEIIDAEKFFEELNKRRFRVTMRTELQL